MNLDSIDLNSISEIETEEATKMSLVLPFINQLGYNIFDINEVVPEYTADMGIKKGEKVDYAIKLNDKINFIIEVKKVDDDLSKHSSQLSRYYAATNTKIAILTNGIKYKFYADLDKNNIMDDKPFYEFNINDYNEIDLTRLDKYKKHNFDEKLLYGKAEELKKINDLTNKLRDELENPSDTFVKFLITDYYDGIKNKNVIDEYKQYVSKIFNKLIENEVEEKVEEKLVDKKEKINDNSNKSIIETTERELAVYNYVQVILHKYCNDDTQITWKDNVSYFNILINNQVKTWFVRVYDRKQMQIGIYNGQKEEKFNIDEPFDVFKYRTLITKAFNFRIK